MTAVELAKALVPILFFFFSIAFKWLALLKHQDQVVRKEAGINVWVCGVFGIVFWLFLLNGWW